MSDCTAVTPIGCDIPLDRSNALPTPPSSSAKPPIFTNRLFTYALGKKIHEILSLSAHTRAVSDYGAVTRLHAEIVDLWRNHHPALRCNNPDTTWDKHYPIVKRQREFAKAMATSVILTLHRDHAAIHQESRFEAMEAALGCLEAQDALMNLLPANQRCIYGLSCHCIDACIFIAYATRLEDTVDQNMLDRVQTGIKQSIMRLRQLENESSFAKHGIQAMEKALELVGPRVQLAVALADDQARNSPLDTALSSSSESIERSLNMALNNGQFYPGIFEQAGDVSLAMPDLGLFGFDVAGHLSTDGGVLGETRYYLDPSRQ
ncbi:Zn(2)-C6 fungal-type domain-containing protein [Fusarium falciforme]|uniref:Zn(2)-C6 fungal-type domain-containing protein n=1 Tax=Fusarium falciforme TaxID=195108 RepID=UPI002300EB2E|nr:Zn(2)-C6 fungal-type domain-containing protein [Fusarium falciforme]WAO87368.1 Zn(2)-C6 fungal-type domain-containing protein [Fusarium falciforme]